MEPQHFSITINAPKERVWETMLGDKTYRQWADVFMPGSYYEGSWDKGSNILFLAPEEDGKLSGMSSRIAENKPYEFISIEHLGFVSNGVEDTTGEQAKSWAGAHENYTLREQDGVTEVLVDLEASPQGVNNKELQDMATMLAELWPKALEKLKTLAEK